MLDLNPIKRHIEIMHAIPLGPDDNPSPADILVKDAEALKAEVERLREALDPFTYAELDEDCSDDSTTGVCWEDEDGCDLQPTVGQIRRARALLGKE